MTVTRRAVFEQLAARSGVEPRETTTVERLATLLDADPRTVETHLEMLEACSLARIRTDGRARITETGQELLELSTDGLVVVDPCGDIET